MCVIIASIKIAVSDGVHIVLHLNSDVFGYMVLPQRCVWLQGAAPAMCLVTGCCPSDVFGYRVLPQRCVWLHGGAPAMCLVTGCCPSDVFGYMVLPQRCVWLHGAAPDPAGDVTYPGISTILPTLIGSEKF